MYKKLQSVVAAAILTTGASLYAYSEDSRKSKDKVVDSGHSTFHYELTQVLAMAAGYSYEDANEVALASNAVDTFPSTLNTTSCEDAINDASLVNDGTLPSILGTVRYQDDLEPELVAQASFFHWGRRPSVNAYGEDYYADGIDADTCNYYGECTYEVSELESWAVAGNKVDAFSSTTVPCVAQPGSGYKDVKEGSLVALGIYLHSLADSYSHQACMKETLARGHSDEGTDGVASCEAREWHLEEEYGEGGSRGSLGAGINYTYNSAIAVYEALKTYGQYNGSAGSQTPPNSEDINLEAFISDFTQTDDADVRSCIAHVYTQNMVEGNYVYEPLTDRTCGR